MTYKGANPPELQYIISLKNNINYILSTISQAQKSPLGQKPVRLIAISKQQPVEAIEKAILAGITEFGENRVQEAQDKWPGLKKAHPDVTLHCVGPLQSNKVAQAVALFDWIQTVDRPKIALSLGLEMKKQQRAVPCLIQVNIGNEPQKSGCAVEDLTDLLAYCRHEAGLDIRGLMCVPPADTPPAPYFALLRKLALEHDLPELSMGMSGDYETAVRMGATMVRVGSAIFGTRSSAA